MRREKNARTCAALPSPEAKNGSSPEIETGNQSRNGERPVPISGMTSPVPGRRSAMNGEGFTATWTTCPTVGQVVKPRGSATAIAGGLDRQVKTQKGATQCAGQRGNGSGVFTESGSERFCGRKRIPSLTPTDTLDKSFWFTPGRSIGSLSDWPVNWRAGLEQRTRAICCWN